MVVFPHWWSLILSGGMIHRSESLHSTKDKEFQGAQPLISFPTGSSGTQLLYPCSVFRSLKFTHVEESRVRKGIQVDCAEFAAVAVVLTISYCKYVGERFLGQSLVCCRSKWSSKFQL